MTNIQFILKSVATAANIQNGATFKGRLYIPFISDTVKTQQEILMKCKLKICENFKKSMKSL
jgi:hypothetical protein